MIPIGILVVPWLLVRFVFATKVSSRLAYKTNAGYLVAAVVAWWLSFVVPHIPISPETDTFSMHLMGGVVAALLFAYAAKAYGVKWQAWWQPWVGLFFFVSGLGVLNELFELLLNRLHYPGMILGDERWDLLANTIGALVMFSFLGFLKKK